MHMSSRHRTREGRQNESKHTGAWHNTLKHTCSRCPRWSSTRCRTKQSNAKWPEIMSSLMYANSGGAMKTRKFIWLLGLLFSGPAKTATLKCFLVHGGWANAWCMSCHLVCLWKWEWRHLLGKQEHTKRAGLLQSQHRFPVYYIQSIILKNLRGLFMLPGNEMCTIAWNLLNIWILFHLGPRGTEWNVNTAET